MRYLALALIILCCARPAWAESDVERYNNANALFRLGDYAGALELYERIDTPHVDVLFNRGVAAWRVGTIGKAMLAFERGRRLAPDDSEIAASIAFLNRQKKDRESEEQGSLIDRLVTFLSLNALIGLTTFFYLAVMAILAARLLDTRWQGTTALPFAAGALLIFFLVAGFRIESQKNRNEAIAMQENVIAHSTPDPNAKEVFTFHEGTKVRVSRIEKEWAKVTVRSGLSGWVEREALERI